MVRFERALARVRWFGIALGLYQVLGYSPDRITKRVPPSMRVVSLSALVFLALVNGIVWKVLERRRRDPRAVRWLGLGVFAADMAALWAITWAFNFEEFGSSWVILLVAPLEGAQRYQLRGALTPVGLAIPLEIWRELARNGSYGFRFSVTDLTFRVAFMAIIAMIAGYTARSLERERAAAEKRAMENAELAAREAAARNESSTFQDVILAGMAEPDLGRALQSMLERISADLGYERVAVLLFADDGRLRPVALHGFAESVRAESVSIDEGISGAVARSGRTEIVPDVTRDPRYVCVEPSTRSQVTIPIRFGGEVIGVVDVESPNVNAFTKDDAARLERLGTNMALVVGNARLLAQERAAASLQRDLDRMTSDFIAIASHELRTPLTAMRGSIKTLRRPELRGEQEKIDLMLEVLDRQSDRLTRLIEDLLIVSRIDAGGGKLEVESLDVGDVCREVLHELGPGGLRVSLAVAPTVPRIVSDAGRLYQIIRNLVENALKFSPENTVVRLNVHNDRDGLLIEVADDGPGIPPEDIPHIFERFHQVGGSLRRRAEGTGLGLYITHRLVEALGGVVDVDSVVGRGSTFWVRIPHDLPTAQPADAETTLGTA
jgi:signal transduction histidine kinase